MLIIRQEKPEDVAAIRTVNEEAFGSTEEADLVEKLRSKQAFTLSLIAAIDKRVVGHILFSPVTIESAGRNFAALGLGPMAVLPPRQKTGIVSQLVRAGLEECKRLGHEVVVVLGHPDYYPRFGFVRASTYAIKWEQDAPDEAFMILELHKGVLARLSGIVKYQPEFSNV